MPVVSLWWSTFRDLVRFAVRRVDEERLTQVAASLTFTTTLSVVPLLTVALAIVTALPMFVHLQDSLRDFFARNLMPDAVSDSAFRYINQFAIKARGLTLIGLIFLTITAVSTMLTIDRALNRIWHVRHPRSLARLILVYWAVLTIGPILLGLSTTLTSYIAAVSSSLVNRPGAAATVLIDAVPFLLLMFGYAALYVYVPNRRVKWRDALIGGFCGSVGFEIAKRLFAAYVSRFPTYTVIYGALAALPIFLLWVYFSWLVTLVGATIAASLPLLRERGWARADDAGQAYADALQLLRLLYTSRAAPVPGIDAEDLSLSLRLGLENCENLLVQLERAALVVRTRVYTGGRSARSNASERWLLAVDPANVSLSRLSNLLVFDAPALAAHGVKEGDPLAPLLAQSRLEPANLTLAEVFASDAPVLKA